MLVADHSYIDYVIFPCFGQLYKNMLSNFIDQKISLYPLTLSIEEFASAAKEVDGEVKVKPK